MSRDRPAKLFGRSQIGIGDLGVIPLFFLVNNWASRPGFTYAARSDGYTLAVNVTAR